MDTLRVLRGALLIALALAACGGAPAVGQAGTPAPDTTALTAGGTPVAAAPGVYYNVSPVQLDGMLKHKDFLLVNVHTPYVGEIPGTDAFIPFQALGDQKVADYPANKGAKVLVYCRTGFMSDIVARALARAGYTNVWNLAGGMDAWTSAGFALSQAHGG